VEVGGGGALVAMAQRFLDVAGVDTGGLEPVGEGVAQAVGGDAVAEAGGVAAVCEGALLIVLGNVLGLLIGFMLCLVIRNSPVAIVAYFLDSFLLPTIFLVLATNQEWFRGPTGEDTPAAASRKRSPLQDRDVATTG
jgi:hypothetical protein